MKPPMMTTSPSEIEKVFKDLDGIPLEKLVLEEVFELFGPEIGALMTERVEGPGDAEYGHMTMASLEARKFKDEAREEIIDAIFYLTTYATFRPEGPFNEKVIRIYEAMSLLKKAYYLIAP